MKVSCPDCHTIYDIDETNIPKAGRSVQCSQCQLVWTVTLDEPLLLLKAGGETLSDVEGDISEVVQDAEAELSVEEEAADVAEVTDIEVAEPVDEPMLAEDDELGQRLRALEQFLQMREGSTEGAEDTVESAAIYQEFPEIIGSMPADAPVEPQDVMDAQKDEEDNVEKVVVPFVSRQSAKPVDVDEAEIEAVVVEDTSESANDAKLVEYPSEEPPLTPRQRRQEARRKQQAQARANLDARAEQVKATERAAKEERAQAQAEAAKKAVANANARQSVAQDEDYISEAVERLSEKAKTHDKVMSAQAEHPQEPRAEAEMQVESGHEYAIETNESTVTFEEEFATTDVNAIDDKPQGMDGIYMDADDHLVQPDMSSLSNDGNNLDAATSAEPAKPKSDERVEETTTEKDVGASDDVNAKETKAADANDDNADRLARHRERAQKTLAEGQANNTENLDHASSRIVPENAKAAEKGEAKPAATKKPVLMRPNLNESNAKLKKTKAPKKAGQKPAKAEGKTKRAATGGVSSSFWTGFFFSVTLLVVLVSVRYLADPIGANIPVASNFMEDYSSLFDSGVEQVSTLLSNI